METLLDSGKYSDLILRCQEKTWKVHRVVLCARSSVFAAMVDGGFKEAQSHEINLPDDEPEIVEKMLRFLYRGDYDDERLDVHALPSEGSAPVDPKVAEPRWPTPLPPFGPPRAPRPPSWGFELTREELREAARNTWREKSLLVNVQVYIIADKNDIGDLKKLATEKYTEVVEKLWDSPSFPSSAKLLYDNTPPSDRLLRDVIAGTAKKNILTLIDKQDFESVMVNHGDLAVDVLKSVLPREREVDSDAGSRTKKNRMKGARGFSDF